MEEPENTILEGLELAEAIRHSPGPITSLWMVTTMADPDTPLFISLDGHQANEAIQRLSAERPGVEFVSVRCTAKIATDIVKVPAEFTSAGCLNSDDQE